MAKKKYKIEYLPIAVQDLEDIFDYIREDNPSAAKSFIDKIDKSILKLETFPKIGSIPDDFMLQQLGYRILVIDNYLVFYVIQDDIVEIRRIIHGKRRYYFLL